MTMARQPMNVSVGVFDGVHLGHCFLLRRMVEDAATKKIGSLCITLEPHPEAVLHPEGPPAFLCSLNQRVARLESLGLDRVEVLPFTGDIAHQTADEFMSWLTGAYEVRGLWGGADFALGRDREGTIAALSDLAARHHFEVCALALLEVGGRPISSNRIRAALAAGDVREAATLLGRPYSIAGAVLHGAHRGREIGFPTANVAPPAGWALPGDGVYFVAARANGVRYRGVANLGARPTFQEHERLLETHILDFSGDLYGVQLEVEFLDLLRPTVRFGSVDELKAQIARDVQKARVLLEDEGRVR